VGEEEGGAGPEHRHDEGRIEREEEEGRRRRRRRRRR